MLIFLFLILYLNSQINGDLGIRLLKWGKMGRRICPRRESFDRYMTRAINPIYFLLLVPSRRPRLRDKAGFGPQAAI